MEENNFNSDSYKGFDYVARPRDNPQWQSFYYRNRNVLKNLHFLRELIYIWFELQPAKLEN